MTNKNAHPADKRWAGGVDYEATAATSYRPADNRATSIGAWISVGRPAALVIRRLATVVASNKEGNGNG